MKLIFFCRRRPDLTHEQYASRLLEGHVPLALKHHPHMQRYVVNIVEHSPPGCPELDSIGELTFASLEDFRERLYDSAAGRAIIERDVAGFMGSADAYAVDEHVELASATDAKPGHRSPGTKLICPVFRRPQLTPGEFVSHWRTTHAPLARRHHVGMNKYVINVVSQRLSKGGEELDGIAELHFPSAAALATGMFDSPEGERVIRADMARFIDRAWAYRTTEYFQR